MAIPLSGANAALFNRLGKLGLLPSDISSFQTTLKPHLIDTSTGILGQYTAEPDLGAQIGTSYVGLLGGLEGPAGVAQSLADATINRMVYRDNPQINQTLLSADTATSIKEIIRQMNNAGATILQISTSAAAPTAFTGTGNGAVVVSLNRPFDGRLLENAFAETLLFSCSADSYTGGATAGNERFNVTGQGSQADLFAFDWPLGSNGLIGIQAINGSANNSQGNLLTNSNFSTFANTANVPDNWTLVTGTAGTQLLQETGIVYASASSLKLVGDGTTKTTITQQFGSSSGTGATLNAQAQYSFNIFMRTIGTVPTQGTLTISLIDQNSRTINDAAGVANSFNFDLTKLSTAWTAFNGVFRTPEALPSQISIQITESTPLNNGAVAYLDQASMGGMTQLYVHGPFVNVHSGSIPFVASPTADYATVAIKNPRGSGGTLNTFQTLLFRLLPIGVSNEILWPSSPSPTISDGLIG